MQPPVMDRRSPDAPRDRRQQSAVTVKTSKGRVQVEHASCCAGCPVMLRSEESHISGNRVPCQPDDGGFKYPVQRAFKRSLSAPLMNSALLPRGCGTHDHKSFSNHVTSGSSGTPADWLSLRGAPWCECLTFFPVPREAPARGPRGARGLISGNRRLSHPHLRHSRLCRNKRSPGCDFGHYIPAVLPGCLPGITEKCCFRGTSPRLWRTHPPADVTVQNKPALKMKKPLHPCSFCLRIGEENCYERQNVVGGAKKPANIK